MRGWQEDALKQAGSAPSNLIPDFESKEKRRIIMAIVKWEPFGELTTLRRQMDRLMESFFGREPLSYERERWIPAVDVAETKDEIVVKAEAKPKEIPIKVG
ncbi:MAG: hypothetical protein DRH21_00180 [Deltaproteobacteria bacterium]|nr:MAG: hypothetical protein DRH21_00180 [Deltaproteobacteria bacterium]